MDKDKAIASLRGEVGGALLKSGTSVWIAPEGTRSKTGELGPFKGGAFRMALDLDVRILPVAIDGTRRILPAKERERDAGPARHGHAAARDRPGGNTAEARRSELMEEVRRGTSPGALAS